MLTIAGGIVIAWVVIRVARAAIATDHYDREHVERVRRAAQGKGKLEE